MSSKGEACCHGISTALMEHVEVGHHVAAARSALARARCAPNEVLRSLAMRDVFDAVDAAEARLVALIDAVPGTRARCRRRMVEVDALVEEAHAWAASLPQEAAVVIDFATLRARGEPRRRPKADIRPRVNENLPAAADDTPAAC